MGELKVEVTRNSDLVEAGVDEFAVVKEEKPKVKRVKKK